MAIVMSKTREQFPLSTKKVLKKTVVGTMIWVILLLIIYGISALSIVSLSETIGNYFGIVTFGFLGFLFLIVVLTYLYQWWYYSVYFYDLTDDYVIIKKGPITPHEITIPYERIQDVYVDQDILDRIFGLYDVHLSSATVSSGMAAHIDGVEKPASAGLRAVLLETVSRKISRNRGQNTPPSNPTPSAQ